MNLQRLTTPGIPDLLRELVVGFELTDAYHAALAKHFGLTDTKNRPAAFSAEPLYEIDMVGDNVGIKIVLTGISRNGPGRTEDQIRAFGQTIYDYVVGKVVEVLNRGLPEYVVDVFVVIVLDGPLGDTKSHLLEYGALIDVNTPPPGYEDVEPRETDPADSGESSHVRAKAPAAISSLPARDPEDYG